MFDLIKSEQGKITNRKIIIKLLSHHGAITKPRLQELTGFTAATLNRTVNSLEQSGLVVVTDVAASSGGRKPLLYGLNPVSAYTIGINISRVYTKAALMDVTGNVLEANTFSMHEKSTPQATMQNLLQAIHGFWSKIDKKKIMGCGVGLVGPIDKEHGIMLNPANFPVKGWDNFKVKERLHQLLGCPVIVENGASAAALGEYRSFYNHLYRNIAFINCGIGVRLGTVVDGAITTHLNGGEGDFGHTCTAIEGELCNCGNYGCLEAYMSTRLLTEKFIDLIKQGYFSRALQIVNYDINALNFATFCTAVEEGDPLATDIVKTAAQHFAIAMSNLINISRPELIVLSGQLINNCNLFYELSTKLALERVQRYSPIQVQFNKGRLQDNAVLVGMSHIVVDQLLE